MITRYLTNHIVLHFGFIIFAFWKLCLFYFWYLIHVTQAGKLKNFGALPNWAVSYIACTKFHLPRPVIHSPGHIFTRIGERTSPSFPAWCNIVWNKVWCFCAWCLIPFWQLDSPILCVANSLQFMGCHFQNCIWYPYKIISWDLMESKIGYFVKQVAYAITNIVYYIVLFFPEYISSWIHHIQ